MAEDFFRRRFPQNIPVIDRKVKSESTIDMFNNCNDICLYDYSKPELSYNEEKCLSKCYHKSAELNAYMVKEFERIFIKEINQYHRKTGV
jgi:hypothetical protein